MIAKVKKDNLYGREGDERIRRYKKRANI